MTQVKTFLAYVEDKDEWGFDGAFIAIHTASETSQSTFESQECAGNYKRDVTSHVIKYKASFWLNKKTQLQGKPSRSLFSKSFVDSDGEVTALDTKGVWKFDEIFTVDLEHEQAKQIMSSGSSKDDTIFNLIEFDLKRRFKQ